MNSHTSDRPFCQAAGCKKWVARVVEVDLPDAWEATRNFTTLTVPVGLCREHGHDVARRIQALLEARSEFHQLLVIIDEAVRYEARLRRQLEGQDRTLTIDSRRQVGGRRQQPDEAEGHLHPGGLTARWSEPAASPVLGTN